MNTPTLLVTNPEWSQTPCVVFDNNIDDCIPEEWIRERYNDELESSKALKEILDNDGNFIDFEWVYDESITLESIKEAMEEEFLSDNAEIEQHWPEHNIAAIAGRAGYEFYFYKYNETGEAKNIVDGSIGDLMEYLSEQ